jgi:hypothetical protein
MVKVPYEKAQAEVVTYNNEDVITTFSGWCLIYFGQGQGWLCVGNIIGVASEGGAEPTSDEIGPSID